MKEIKYNGNLIEDIKLMTKGINATDITTNDILTDIVESSLNVVFNLIFSCVFYFVIPDVFQLQGIINLLFKIGSVFLVTISTYDVINDVLKLNKYIKNKKKQTTKNIRKFCSSLQKEHKITISRDNILISSKSNKMICYIDEEKNKIMLEKESNNEEQYIYLLDRSDRIHILKQFRAKLFLLDEEEVMIYQKQKSLEKIK